MSPMDPTVRHGATLLMILGAALLLAGIVAGAYSETHSIPLAPGFAYQTHPYRDYAMPLVGLGCLVIAVVFIGYVWAAKEKGASS